MTKKRKRTDKGKKGLLAVVLIAAATVLTGIVLLVWLAGRPTAPTAGTEVSVYFSDEEGLYLKAEKRTIDKGHVASEAAAALRELVRGPVNAALGSVMPEGTRLLGVRVDGPVATADFSRELVQNHPGGSSGEIQTVYSIVNTLALNFPEINEVQILVEGAKQDTIAGHIDITEPLAPDRKIIKD